MIVYLDLEGRRVTLEVLDVIRTHATLDDVQIIFELPSRYLDDWAIKLQETVLQQEAALLDKASSYVIALEEGALGVSYNAAYNGLNTQDILHLRECIIEAHTIYQADPVTAPVTDAWDNLKYVATELAKKGQYARK